MAMLISSVVGGVTSKGESVGAASMSGEFNGAGVFRSSSECPNHLLLWTASEQILDCAKHFLPLDQIRTSFLSNLTFSV